MKFVQICGIRNYLYALCDDGNIYFVNDGGIWHKIEPPQEERKELENEKDFVSPGIYE